MTPIRRSASIPSLEQLPAPPERIIWHWTAGDHLPTNHELGSYHYLVSLDKRRPDDPDDDLVDVEPGVRVHENMGNVGRRPDRIGDPTVRYAAHTNRWNSRSVGLALCGMRGAADYRPSGGVDPGSAPITRKQVRAALGFTWSLCVAWNLDPSDPADLTTHYEAEWLHGVDQYPIGEGSWRWDVTWIPGLSLPSREDYGYWIREQVSSFGGTSTVEW